MVKMAISTILTTFANIDVVIQKPSPHLALILHSIFYTHKKLQKKQRHIFSISFSPRPRPSTFIASIKVSCSAGKLWKT